MTRKQKLKELREKQLALIIGSIAMTALLAKVSREIDELETLLNKNKNGK